MGLDIYFYRTKHAYNGDRDEVVKLTNKDAVKEIRKEYSRYIKEISSCNEGVERENKSVECAKRLAKLFNYPYISLENLGVSHDYENDKDIFSPVPLSAWVDNKKEIISWACAKHDAYFRKVNFLFAYFENRGKMEDECFAWVEQEDVEEIIDRCEKVLADHKLAEELLPTQGGFFFGGTDYDEYYFHCVENVLEKMKGLIPIFRESYNMYVYFSW